MAVWKQLVLCLLVLFGGVLLWIGFAPGSRETLARWGLELPAFAAIAPTSDNAEAGRPNNRGGGSGDRAAAVVAYPATRGTINDRLSAIGTGEALRSVAVMPFVSGRIVEVRVRSGDRITAGDVIANLDADVERIAVDRARIALENAQAALDRATALLNSRTVTAVAQTEAKLAVENARLELAQAELTLERRSIVAPIDGVVGILPVEVGDYVTSQTQIVTLDDRSELVINFWAPERFANAIEVGAPISATSVARPGQTFTGEVSALDNRLDAASRTLRVQARVDNPNDTLRAGMSFQVQMGFPGDTYP
nr:efflux RND transporter periplasmic adaptor subunit [Tianweitania sediminis]